MNIAKIEPKNAVAAPKTVKGWLSSDYFKTQVSLCLPRHLTADRFVRVALTAVTRIPKLAECTPESVIKCLMTCSELGLEPDGRRFHLIPFFNSKLQRMECQGITDYKGLVELVRNNGDVSVIRADVVCDRDSFEYRNGEVDHSINFRIDRGEMYAAYVIITFKDGAKHCEVMTKAEIDAIRRRSKAANNGPWVTDYNEMAKKTVFRRASKWITLSPEVADALDKADPLPNAQLVSEAGLTLPDATPEPIALEPSDAPAETDEHAEAGDSLAPAAPEKSAPTSPTHQEELAALVLNAGYTFDQFQRWGKDSGNLPDGDSIGRFDEVPEQTAKRLRRAHVGLLKGLATIKAGGV